MHLKRHLIQALLHWEAFWEQLLGGHSTFFCNFYKIGAFSDAIVVFPWQAYVFIITYLVNNATDKESDEIRKAMAREKAFMQLAKVCKSCTHVFFVLLMFYILRLCHRSFLRVFLMMLYLL